MIDQPKQGANRIDQVFFFSVLQAIYDTYQTQQAVTDAQPPVGGCLIRSLVHKRETLIHHRIVDHSAEKTPMIRKAFFKLLRILIIKIRILSLSSQTSFKMTLSSESRFNKAIASDNTSLLQS